MSTCISLFYLTFALTCWKCLFDCIFYPILFDRIHSSSPWVILSNDFSVVLVRCALFQCCASNHPYSPVTQTKSSIAGTVWKRPRNMAAIIHVLWCWCLLPVLCVSGCTWCFCVTRLSVEQGSSWMPCRCLSVRPVGLDNSIRTVWILVWQICTFVFVKKPINTVFAFSNLSVSVHVYMCVCVVVWFARLRLAILSL